MYIYTTYTHTHIPHEKLVGTQQVSNLSTVNQVSKLSTVKQEISNRLASLIVVQIEHVLQFVVCGTNKTTGGGGRVATPHPRSFWCGIGE